MRTFRGGRVRELSGAAALVVAGMALPAGAVNLLENPGFESPGDNQPTDNTATGWTFTNPTVQRAGYYNHTPGGTYSIDELVWQSSGGGIYQVIPNIAEGQPVTLSAYYYFEQNFSQDKGTTVDLGLTWLNSSSAEVGENYDDLESNAVPLSSWTQYSLSAIAPPGATQVRVSFDYNNPNGANAGGAQSAFVDDADLEPIETFESAMWNVDASGDWNNPGNWNFGVPNGVNNTAELWGAITSARTVYTNTAVTLGTLWLNNPNEYVISGAGSLTLLSSNTDALVEVEQGTQKLALPVTIASNTVLDVASGATLIVSNPLTIDAGMSVTQSGGGTVTYQSIVTVESGATMAFGDSTVGNSLDLQGGSRASVDASAAGWRNVVQFSDVSLGIGSQFDLKNNELEINYAGGADPIATIQAYLKSAYNGGLWNGAGIVSSSAVANRGYGLGYADGNTDQGTAATPGELVVVYALVGDANLDGTVNLTDLLALLNNYGQTGRDWTEGDFNYDGAVNLTDLLVLLDNYGESASGSAASAAPAVPEPDGLGILAIGAMALNYGGGRMLQRVRAWRRPWTGSPRLRQSVRMAAEAVL